MLDGKRALVLGGGGTGIGRDVVRVLGAQGAAVAVGDRDVAAAQEAVDELRSGGRSAWAVVGDVTDAEQLGAMFDQALAGLGGLDALVTVVGGQVAFVPAVQVHEMSDADWDLVHDVNLRYVFRAVRRALGVFLEQGGGGAIVSVGSVTGFMAAPLQAGYGSAKAGLLSFARTVAAEYARDRIRMNVVAGGAIATGANRPPNDDWVDEIPLGRYGATGEVAAAVAYLLSDHAAYVTGQRLVLDGGVSVRGPFG